MAHRIQFYSPSVLNIIGQLRALIAPTISIESIETAATGIDLPDQRPQTDPSDEAQNIIDLLRHVYDEAVGELYAMVKKTVRDSCFDCPAIVQLAIRPATGTAILS